MLQADDADDYVLATGTGTLLRNFVEATFSPGELDWETHVRFDERYLQAAAWTSCGGASIAYTHLGWEASITASDLAWLMVDADIAALGHGTAWVDTPDLADWPVVPRS